MSKKTKSVAHSPAPLTPGNATAQPAAHSMRNDPAPEPKPDVRPRRPARVEIDPPAKKSTASASKQPSATTPTATPAPSKPRQRSVEEPLKLIRGKREAAPIASIAPKRPSALDAAAEVLAALKGTEARDGITAPDLIERMKKAKLWSSPGGKTPAATLYAGMTREAAAKGNASRFRRVAPGRFIAGPAAKSRAKVKG